MRLLASRRMKDFPSFFRPSKKQLHGPLRWAPDSICPENDAQMDPQMILKWSQSVVPRAMIFQNGQYAIRTRRRSPNQCYRPPGWHTFCSNIIPNPQKTTSSKAGPRKNCQNSPRSQKKMIQGRKCAKNDPLQVDPRTIFFSFFSSRVLNASPGGGSRVGFSMILDDLDLIFHHCWTRFSSMFG